MCFALLLSVICGCNRNEDVDSVGYDESVSDVLISELKVETLSSMGNGDYVEHVSFRDSVSAEEYVYSITYLKEDSCIVSFRNLNQMDTLCFNILSYSDDSCVIQCEDGGVYSTVLVNSMGIVKGSVLFELADYSNGINPLKGRIYESWGDCVKRLALNENIVVATGVASAFSSSAALYVVAAAGIICSIRENRLYVDTPINPQLNPK